MLRSERVIVIDDSAEKADAMARALYGEGFDVQVVYDGAGGIDAVSLHRPGSVVIDTHMPRVDGFEVARCLRAVHRQVPLLIGIIDPQFPAEDASRLDVFDHCLTRPVDLAALCRLLPALRESA